jgi:hypothetical protein
MKRLFEFCYPGPPRLRKRRSGAVLGKLNGVFPGGDDLVVGREKTT